MQRWHLTKAVNRQVIEVKQTDEHSAAHGRRRVKGRRWHRPPQQINGGGAALQPVDTHPHGGHVDLHVQ